MKLKHKSAKLASTRDVESPDMVEMLYGTRGRMSQLWFNVKLPVLWSLAAFISLGTLASIATSDMTRQRMAQMPQDIDLLVSQGSTADSTSLNQLRAERAKLEQRVAELERNFGDITASIPKKATPKQDGDITGSINSTQVDPVLEGKGGVTVATRSQFGVELASEGTPTALRLKWDMISQKYAVLLNGYEPIISIRETGDGRSSLLLVAGPFADIMDAATLCAKLRTAGYSGCVPSTYDGQKLAVR